jgi:hypothetical protein
MEIIFEITITLARVFQNIIDNLKVNGIVDAAKKMNSSLQLQVAIFYIIKLLSIYQEHGRFTYEIKEEIAKMLSEEHQQAFQKNDSVMSKVLKLFEDGGIIFKVRGKDMVKKKSPESIARRVKGSKPRRVKGSKPRRAGPFIISKLKPTIEEYKQILSDPRAVELVNQTLSKDGVLREAYPTIIRESFHALKEGDESFYNALEKFNPNIDSTSLPTPKLFQEQFKSLSEGEMESLQKETITHFVKNPSFPIFFIFSLSKFANYRLV